MESDQSKLLFPVVEVDAHKENSPRNFDRETLSRPRLCRFHGLPQCSLCTTCVTSALHQVLAGSAKGRTVSSSSTASCVGSRAVPKTYTPRSLKMVVFLDLDDNIHSRDVDEDDMDMDVDEDLSVSASQSSPSFHRSASTSSFERCVGQEGRHRSFSPTRFCGAKNPHHRRHSIPPDANDRLHLLYMDAGRLPWQLKDD